MTVVRCSHTLGAEITSKEEVPTSFDAGVLEGTAPWMAGRWLWFVPVQLAKHPSSRFQWAASVPRLISDYSGRIFPLQHFLTCCLDQKEAVIDCTPQWTSSVGVQNLFFSLCSFWLQELCDTQVHVLLLGCVTYFYVLMIHSPFWKRGVGEKGKGQREEREGEGGGVREKEGGKGEKGREQ